MKDWIEIINTDKLEPLGISLINSTDIQKITLENLKGVKIEKLKFQSNYYERTVVKQ